MFLSSLVIAIIAFMLGLLCFPLVMFLRARRSSAWDNSNMTNIYRVLAHLSTRPGDFAKMQYPSGKKPFWYLNKDELSEVVDSEHE